MFGKLADGTLDLFESSTTNVKTAHSPSALCKFTISTFFGPAKAVFPI